MPDFLRKTGVTLREDHFFGGRLAKFFGDLFFGRHLRLVSLALVSSIPVLGKWVLSFGLGFFCVLGLGLEPGVLDSEL